MTARPIRRALGLALLAAACTAPVAAAPNDAEHRRIAAERAAANALFAERERECNRRFVVTGCVNDARTEQRATLARLHRETLVLDESQRRAAAELRRKEIADKAADTARENAAPASAVAREPARHAPVPNPVKARVPAGSDAAPSSTRAVEANRRAEEARHRAAFDAKASAASAHRATIERRNTERAAEGKSAKPLPPPAGASASAR